MSKVQTRRTAGSGPARAWPRSLPSAPCHSDPLAHALTLWHPRTRVCTRWQSHAHTLTVTPAHTRVRVLLCSGPGEQWRVTFAEPLPRAGRRVRASPVSSSSPGGGRSQPQRLAAGRLAGPVPRPRGLRAGRRGFPASGRIAQCHVWKERGQRMPVLTQHGAPRRGWRARSQQWLINAGRSLMRPCLSVCLSPEGTGPQGGGDLPAVTRRGGVPRGCCPLPPPRPPAAGRSEGGRARGWGRAGREALCAECSGVWSPGPMR